MGALKNVLFAFIILLFFFHCGNSSKVAKKSEFDTSNYHLTIGNQLLIKYSHETNRVKQDYYLSKAESELNRAQKLDEQANRGELYTSLGVLQYYKKNYTKAIENFTIAQKENYVEAFLELGKLYFETQQDKDWQQKAEGNFIQVLNRNPGHEQANFYLGQLNYEKLDFEQAKKYLSKSSNSTNFGKESRGLLKNIDVLSKLNLKAPVSRYIGTREKITRAESAYLIMNELLFAESSKNQTAKKIADLPENIYKISVQEIINRNVMELDRNNNFYPENEITRIEFSRIILKLYILKTKNLQFGVQYAGVQSPIQDIRNSNPDFVPAVFMVENNFLKLDKNKNFNKDETVNGVEALTVLGQFEELLKLAKGR